ncbi:FF domain protein [Talaromyces proteolyticus]|uniref:FF domain protein n=1 Tax=Talaromyces proteolyticus TaxID=1131652 RepID=A0AAD4Q0V1_9EURO|nr:FF domain protein [Talaromyces proteolyticus]KAH8704905.1 FF domain protein [Talaromyces proteolyticus]
MLKSTYAAPPPLPPGWTEHRAPSGHSYYYNSETKQSTYKRPSIAPTLSPAPAESLYNPETLPPFSSTPYGPTIGDAVDISARDNSKPQYREGFRSRDYHDRRHRQPEDRPKHKHGIPGCSPWLLVQTKLGRRFVYNPETNESYWKFPEDVLKGVVEFDRSQREKKQKGVREDQNVRRSEHVAEHQKQELSQSQEVPVALANEEESDEYEEVEVTDSEGDEEQSSKRLRVDSDNQSEEKHLEFDEDDIEYQLRAMGEEYGLDPGEYGEPGDEGWEEGAEGLSLTDEEATALFRDLLDDLRINPFTTWEKVVEEGRIIEDTRYTALSTMKSRREVFAAWSRDRIQEVKMRKEKEETKDPRIKYLAFLHEHATPKLYWPEFKRKYRKEDVMKNTRMADKEREKFYRDHIGRLKLSESTRKSDLSTLLKSIPLHLLNSSSSIEALPSALLTDLRFISLPTKVRDPLVETYISTLSSAPDEDMAALSIEEQQEHERKKMERFRREKAFADRERQVDEEKRRRRGDLLRGKNMLRQEEAEIEEALNKRGKEGLKKYMDQDAHTPENESNN